MIAGYRGTGAPSGDVTSRLVDAANADSLRRAFRGIDCVISAVPQRSPVVQRVCAEQGIPSVDVSADYDIALRARKEVPPDSAPQVVCAGQAPGVTGLMALELYQATSGPVRVGFLIADRARSGATGVADMLRAVQDAEDVSSFCYAGLGRRTAARLRTDESALMRQPLPLEVGVAFEKDAVNRAVMGLRAARMLSLLTRPGVARRLARPRQHPHDEAILLTAVSGEERLVIRSESDYLGTACAAVTFARMACRTTARGVLHPGDMTTLEQVVREIPEALSRVSGPAPDHPCG